MTPAEGAFCLGIPNLAMCVYADKPEPPFDQLTISFRPLQQVVWSIVGDSNSQRNNQQTDLEEVIGLASRFPNVTGAVLDDFFHAPDSSGSISRWSVRDLEIFRDRLHGAAQSLDLWVAHYQENLDLPAADHLRACDVVLLAAWEHDGIFRREADLERLDAVAPSKRTVLCCYLWDYGAQRPLPVDLMQRQVRDAHALLRRGRIEGILFCASCICDLDLETVEWTRRWIAEVGEEASPDATPPHAPGRTRAMTV
jgi:hypothetical protein